MNKHKTKICLPLLFIIFSSCNSQTNKFIDLEKISYSFNVQAFYQKRIDKTKEILATNPKNLDRKLALDIFNSPFFAKDTLGIYKSDGRFPTELCLEANNDWMSRDQKPSEIFGYEYRTVAHNPDRDTLAVLNNVIFPKIDMAEDLKGNLIYLEVGKTAKSPTDYEKIKDYLEKNCKKVNIEDDHKNITYWENQYFFYHLTSRGAKEEKILSYDLQGNKTSEMIDVTEINLIMYKKSYIKKMEELNIYSPGEVFWKKAL